MCTPENEEQALINIKTNQNHIDRLYACRDLEIKNLWQRSIFLASFLVLCYTAYGALIGNILGQYRLADEKIWQYNTAIILLSFVGIILSVLWICMAKGSKAWQEVYEDAIGKFEEQYLSKDIPKDFRSKELSGCHDKRDLCLFSVNGGPYSPSKINIVIGQISLIIWSCIPIGHFLYLMICYSQAITECYGLIIGIAFGLMVIILLILRRNPYKQNKHKSHEEKADNQDTDKRKKSAKNKHILFNIVSEHLSRPKDDKDDKDDKQNMEKAEKPESE